jgi:hypothetical protein
MIYDSLYFKIYNAQEKQGLPKSYTHPKKIILLCGANL